MPTIFESLVSRIKADASIRAEESPFMDDTAALLNALATESITSHNNAYDSISLPAREVFLVSMLAWIKVNNIRAGRIAQEASISGASGYGQDRDTPFNKTLALNKRIRADYESSCASLGIAVDGEGATATVHVSALRRINDKTDRGVPISAWTPPPIVLSAPEVDIAAQTIVLQWSQDAYHNWQTTVIGIMDSDTNAIIQSWNYASVSGVPLLHDSVEILSVPVLTATVRSVKLQDVVFDGRIKRFVIAVQGLNGEWAYSNELTLDLLAVPLSLSVGGYTPLAANLIPSLKAWYNGNSLAQIADDGGEKVYSWVNSAPNQDSSFNLAPKYQWPLPEQNYEEAIPGLFYGVDFITGLHPRAGAVSFDGVYNGLESLSSPLYGATSCEYWILAAYIPGTVPDPLALPSNWMNLFPGGGPLSAPSTNGAADLGVSDGQMSSVYTHVQVAGDQANWENKFRLIGGSLSPTTKSLYLEAVPLVLNAAHTYVQTTQPMRLGAFPVQGGLTYEDLISFKGLVSDVYIFSEALTDFQRRSFLSWVSLINSVYQASYNGAFPTVLKHRIFPGIRVVWEVSDDYTHTQIWRRTGTDPDTAFVLLSTVPVETTYLHDPDAGKLQTYTYKARGKKDETTFSGFTLDQVSPALPSLASTSIQGTYVFQSYANAGCWVDVSWTPLAATSSFTEIEILRKPFDNNPFNYAAYRIIGVVPSGSVSTIRDQFFYYESSDPLRIPNTDLGVYSYIMRGVGPAGYGEFSYPRYYGSLPRIPTVTTTYTAPGLSPLLLQWAGDNNVAPGANAIEIWRNIDSLGWTLITAWFNSVNQFYEGDPLPAGVDPNAHVRQYKLRLLTFGSPSEFSDVLTVNFSKGPHFPAAITATRNGFSIDLAWTNDYSYGAYDIMEIWRSSNYPSAPFVLYDTIGETDNYSDSGAVPGLEVPVTYAYKIRVRNGGGYYGGFSSVVTSV